MPSFKQFYGGQYLSAKALANRKIKGKILEVGPETIKDPTGNEKTQLVITLANCDKRVPVNATNAQRLGERFGDDYLKWQGKLIEVSTANTNFNGAKVKGLLLTPLSK